MLVTKQITIKLNERKFKPILDNLNRISGHKVKTYSELAGKCIWFCHVFGTKKMEKLGNKSHFEFMAQMRGMTTKELLKDLSKKYRLFAKKEGKL